MKRVVSLVVVSLAFALALSGCSRSISGDVDEVVDECLELPEDTNATVEVTGYVYVPTYDFFELCSSKDGSGESITCNFDDPSLIDDVEFFDRVTVRGSLNSSMLDTMDLVWLSDCEIVD